MAITPPTEYQVVQWQEISSKVDLGQNPLHKILQNTNYLYGYHRPAVVNVAPLNNISTSGTTSTSLVIRAPLSADGLKYEVDWYAYNGSNGATRLRIYETTASTSTGWGSAVIDQSATFNGGQWNNTTSASAFTANATFLSFLFTSAVNAQLEAVIIRPAPITSIDTAATYASGFVPYDDDILTATGGPINPEHINRACNNAAAVMADRQQCVFSLINDGTALARITKSGADTIKPIAMGQAHLPGQAGAVLDVYVKANDSGGSAKVFVGEIGGEKISLNADGADRSGTLTITTDNPTFTVDVMPDAGTDLYYVAIHWKPGEVT